MRAASSRSRTALTGFVFKIQANMDPGHRDRVAFMRLCSGRYQRGMRMYHTRLRKEVRIADALTFMAADRQQAEEAYAGDIIGLHNHGTINIGDSFSEGEALGFTGIPDFAPELFRRAVLKDPLRMKALTKGLAQLCEEGATQLFRPLRGAELILGAVGQLQFEVVAFRLADEYAVQCVFDDRQRLHRALGECHGRGALRGIPGQGLRAAGARPWRGAGLPGAVARQPAADDGALAGDPLQRDARAPATWRGLTACRRGCVRSAPGR